MSFRSVSWYLIKLLFSAFVGSGVGYLVKSLVSSRTDYFLDAISPVILYNEIASGNVIIIFFAILGAVIFIMFK